MQPFQRLFFCALKLHFLSEGNKSKSPLTNKRGICLRGLHLFLCQFTLYKYEVYKKANPLLFHKKGYASRLQPLSYANLLYTNMRFTIKEIPLLINKRGICPRGLPLFLCQFTLYKYEVQYKSKSPLDIQERIQRQGYSLVVGVTGLESYSDIVFCFSLS